MRQHTGFHGRREGEDLAANPSLYRSGAPYEGLVKAVTAAAWVGLTSMDAWIAYLALNHIIPSQPSLYIVAITVTTTLSVLLGTFLFSPRGFELTWKGLVIKRPLKSFVIPYNEIVAVERVRIPRSGIRLFASGGIHGFFGLFRLKGIGRVWMYVTDRNKGILIKTKRGVQYIISPENPDAFLDVLKAMLGKTGNSEKPLRS